MKVDTTVVCVYKTGGDYDKRYVEKLYQSAMKHGAEDFVCFTDDLSVLDICEVIPLEKGYPGWWSKLEIFKFTYGQYVYFDLDTIIHGDIRHILEYKHNFTMLKDFNEKVNRPASGFLAWNGDYSYLYNDFKLEMAENEYNHLKGGKLGDQAYISDYLGFKPDLLQEIFPNSVSSHKWDNIQTRNDTPIVCYHGKPRPHETNWSI